MYDEEFIEGKLKQNPISYDTKGKKFLCRGELKGKDEDYSIIGWEENGEILNELKQNDTMIVKGYRKYNDFLKKEEFVITQFIKRN